MTTLDCFTAVRKDGVRRLRLRKEMSQQANDVAIHEDAGLLHCGSQRRQGAKHIYRTTIIGLDSRRNRDF